MSELRFESSSEAVELLKSHGFKVLRETVDIANFGNALLDLKRGNVRVRLVRDRGEHFVQVGSTVEPDRWFSASLALELFSVHAIESRPLEPSAMANVARRIVGIFGQLDAAFSRAEWTETSRQLEAARLRRRKEQFGY